MRVRLAHRIDDLHGHPEDLAELERRPPQPRVERLALHVLHRDEAAAVGFADFVDGADVGMIEGRRGARLSQQAPLCQRIGLGLR